MGERAESIYTPTRGCAAIGFETSTPSNTGVDLAKPQSMELCSSAQCRASNDNSEGTMKDLAIELDNRPGALAEMGEALGRAGVSVEGRWINIAP